MEKDEDYSAQSMPPSFASVEYSQDHQHHQEQLLMKSSRIVENPGTNSSNGLMVDYLLNNPHPQQPQYQTSSAFCGSTSLDKLSFADVMQFADFGPKLALKQTKMSDEESGMDPVYFLKFPVLNDRVEGEDQADLMAPSQHSFGARENDERLNGVGELDNDQDARVSDPSLMQLRFLGEDQNVQNNPLTEAGKNKRKRTRTLKTSEEVESQRMTHIAVERNRRKQMNEHLRVLRSLMPGSYVQRGDQASIIGGAIEFVRELEQLLQCLESQKRRRVLGDSSIGIQQQSQPQFLTPNNLPLQADGQIKFMEFETGLREETAENKSCLADVEVKLLGFDAMIKILSRRRPGQLIKTIAALEDLQLNILHTNITTIEQTVLYSFNVKVASESRVTAEDIASSVQQIFSFIHANSGM